MSKNGIHHVTAISGPARRNHWFYTQILGLRLVKKTVNFDDPTTYHFYYGDGTGQPGTILTFFPWEHTAPGRPGAGEAVETAFRVPLSALAAWRTRFQTLNVTQNDTEMRFGDSRIDFKDPDGTKLALVGVPELENEPGWSGGGVAPEFAIRGLHSVTLLLEDPARTAAILSDLFDFSETGRDGTTARYRAEGSGAGSIIDLRRAGVATSGRLGAGSGQHIAFRAAEDAEQFAMMRKLAANHGIRTTEQKDRSYFRSLYFREPGGVLFEIATDIPGFAIDEPADELGRSLKLPKPLEPHRHEIEAGLPPLAA